MFCSHFAWTVGPMIDAQKYWKSHEFKWNLLKKYKSSKWGMEMHIVFCIILWPFTKIKMIVVIRIMLKKRMFTVDLDSSISIGFKVKGKWKITFFNMFLLVSTIRRLYMDSRQFVKSARCRVHHIEINNDLWHFHQGFMMKFIAYSMSSMSSGISGQIEW